MPTNLQFPELLELGLAHGGSLGRWSDAAPTGPARSLVGGISLALALLLLPAGSENAVPAGRRGELGRKLGVEHAGFVRHLESTVKRLDPNTSNPVLPGPANGMAGITAEEEKRISSLLGDKCSVMGSAAVQVYMAKPGDGTTARRAPTR